MLGHPEPITFTVAPLGHVNIPETENAVILANVMQGAFRFMFHSDVVFIKEDKYKLKNGALDLDKVVRALLKRQRFRRLASGRLILVTSKPYADPSDECADQDLIDQCYFYDDGLSFAKNISIVSTYIWDRLPNRADLFITASGRRALQPYLLLMFAITVVNQLTNMLAHQETRGCPFDYCYQVQDVDRFFERGSVCDECERTLQIKCRGGEITADQLDSVKKLLRRAIGKPYEYDVFISHASEDKDAIARSLYAVLVERGVKVWFDEGTLELGDSLRRKIDDGLARCRFGIVILSPHFLRKEWPQRELDGLVARETASGEKAILPIWHELDAAALRRYSPTLADRLAARSEEGIPALVDQILRVLKR